MQIHEQAMTAALPDIHLSPREAQVLPMLLRGESSKQIAQKPAISPRTVDIYRSSILGKMRVRKTTQLILALQGMNYPLEAVLSPRAA